MNKVILIGNLTKENDVRANAKGTTVVRNTIAVKRDKDTTDFINFVAFGKTGELLSKYTTKGNQVCLSGELRSSVYEKEGKKIYSQDFVVTEIQLLGSKKQEEKKTEVKKEETSIPSAKQMKITDEDLPF